MGVHIPILDVTFNGATVTNSPQPTPLITVDIVHQATARWAIFRSTHLTLPPSPIP